MSRPITNLERIAGTPAEDRILEYFDRCLTACNKILAPLTKEFEVSDIMEELLQHISTHMDTELCTIYNGPSDDCWHELSDENKKTSMNLRAKDKEHPFPERRRHSPENAPRSS